MVQKIVSGAIVEQLAVIPTHGPPGLIRRLEDDFGDRKESRGIQIQMSGP